MKGCFMRYKVGTGGGLSCFLSTIMNYPNNTAPSTNYSPSRRGSQPQSSQASQADQSTQPGSLSGNGEAPPFGGLTRTNTSNTILPGYSGVSAEASPPSYTPPTKKQTFVNYLNKKATQLRAAETTHLQASESRSRLRGKGKLVRESEYAGHLATTFEQVVNHINNPTRGIHLDTALDAFRSALALKVGDTEDHRNFKIARDSLYHGVVSAACPDPDSDLTLVTGKYRLQVSKEYWHSVLGGECPFVEQGNHD
jgi:hypothetical protein